MRCYAKKLLKFRDDLGIWNQYGLSMVVGIEGILLF